MNELPANSLGLYFLFKVKVITKYSLTGVDSLASDPILLAGVPDKPSAAPSRGSLTSDTMIHTLITAVSGTNGAPVLSYDIEIDDGLGGAFVEL